MYRILNQAVIKLEIGTKHSSMYIYENYNLHQLFSCIIYFLTTSCINDIDSESTRGRFYYHILTLIPARISNHMLSKVCDGITYAFPNFQRLYRWS